MYIYIREVCLQNFGAKEGGRKCLPRDSAGAVDWLRPSAFAEGRNRRISAKFKVMVHVFVLVYEFVLVS